MDVVVLAVLQIKLFTGCPYVPFLVPVGSQIAVKGCDEDVAPKIEFAFVVKQGFVNVLLNNIGDSLSIFVFVFVVEQVADVPDVVAHHYSVASI